MHSSIIAETLPQVNGSMWARVYDEGDAARRIRTGSGFVDRRRRQVLFRGLFQQNAIHSFALLYFKYERRWIRAMSCKMADIW